jgi:hypothetical protein
MLPPHRRGLQLHQIHHRENHRRVMPDFSIQAVRPTPNQRPRNSAVPTVHIHSFKQFLDETPRTSGVVYRGQARDYGTLIPSIFRKTQALDEDASMFLFYELHREIYGEFEREIEPPTEEPSYQATNSYRAVESDPPESGSGFGQWLGLEEWPEDQEKWGTYVDFSNQDDSELWSDLGPGHGLGDGYNMFQPNYPPPEPMSTDVLARLQHYGIPTPTLDVTFDRIIALWFATHRFKETGPRSGYYVRNDDGGVVYVLQPPPSAVYDLRKQYARAIAGWRGTKQEAALLLGATADKSDLSHHVIKKLLISPKVFDEITVLGTLRVPRLREISQHYLFPPDDKFYRLLLDAKHGNQAERLRRFRGKAGSNEQEVQREVLTQLASVIEYQSPPGVVQPLA